MRLSVHKLMDPNHWQATFLCNSGCILNIIFQTQSTRAPTFIVIKASNHPINDQLLQKQATALTNVNTDLGDTSIQLNWMTCTQLG